MAGLDTAARACLASDLLLFIMGRRTSEEMQIEGDETLAAMCGDLAGRF
jgi:hypothetical protein